MVPKPMIFVVDDDPALRESLKWLIESVDLDVQVHASAKEFLEACDTSLPGCLVLDIRMPEMDGLELQAKLDEVQIHLPVIFITGHGEVPMAVQAMKAGAFDFIEKPFSDQELLGCIERALARDAQERKRRARQESVAARVSLLTPRERQVMEMMTTGKPTKAIAQELGLSPKTVEIHRSRVTKKMQARNLAHLVQIVLGHSV